jgi:hypothetical protein
VEELLELTAALSLEGGVTFPLPPAALPDPAPAPAPSPAWASSFSAFEKGADALPLPLAQVVFGEEDAIPGVTRSPSSAAPTPAAVPDASPGAGGGGAAPPSAGGGAGEAAPDMARVLRVLQGLSAPLLSGEPPAGAEESDAEAVEALLRSGTLLGEPGQ